MDQLNPCPFCKDGGKPYVLTGKCYTFENGIGSMVECEKCLSSGPLCNTEEEAIAAWNKRAEDTCEGCKYDQFKSGIRCSLCTRNKRDYYLPLKEE